MFTFLTGCLQNIEKLSTQCFHDTAVCVLISTNSSDVYCGSQSLGGTSKTNQLVVCSYAQCPTPCIQHQLLALKLKSRLYQSRSSVRKVNSLVPVVQ